jgi:hypothetical protein
MTNTAPSLDPVRRIPARIAQIGVSLSFLGRCVGLSSGEISQLFSKRKLSPTKTKTLSAAVDNLEMVARAFAPAPILFKDHELILSLIKDLKSGELIIAKSRNGVQEFHGGNAEGWGDL